MFSVMLCSRRSGKGKENRLARVMAHRLNAACPTYILSNRNFQYFGIGLFVHTEVTKCDRRKRGIGKLDVQCSSCGDGSF